MILARRRREKKKNEGYKGHFAFENRLFQPAAGGKKMKKRRL